MAITKITKITRTVGKAISYGIEDKILEIVKDETETADEILNCKTIKTPINCSLSTADKEWELVRKRFNKNSKILAHHVFQNFGVGEDQLDPKTANKIGVELANKLFKGHQCIVATHTNTKYVHNHIIFNSVNLESGKKYIADLNSYKKLRKISDKLCSEYNLPVLEETRDFKLKKFEVNGKIKYFEPTEKKRNMAQLKGNFQNNDYRNSKSYHVKYDMKESNKSIIIRDIDFIIENKTLDSYESMLQELFKIDYEIKAKTKKGTWRKHVSFKAPNQEKFTRDQSLGNEYTREMLEIRIASNNRMKSKINTIINENICINNSSNKVLKLCTDDLIEKKNDLKNIFKKEEKFKDREEYFIDCIKKDINAINIINEEKFRNNLEIKRKIEEIEKLEKNIEIEMISIKNDIDLLYKVDDQKARILENNYLDLSNKLNKVVKRKYQIEETFETIKRIESNIIDLSNEKEIEKNSMLKDER